MTYNNNQQQPKNPNGGYLNPGKMYGGWIGTIELTPEVLQAALNSLTPNKEGLNVGRLTITASDPKNNSNGEPYVRITAKTYDDSWEKSQQQAGVYNQAPTQAPQQHGMPPAAPAPSAPLPQDDIPF